MQWPNDNRIDTIHCRYSVMILSANSGYCYYCQCVFYLMTGVTDSIQPIFGVTIQYGNDLLKATMIPNIDYNPPDAAVGDTVTDDLLICNRPVRL